VGRFVNSFTRQGFTAATQVSVGRAGLSPLFLPSGSIDGSDERIAVPPAPFVTGRPTLNPPQHGAALFFSGPDKP